MCSRAVGATIALAHFPPEPRVCWAAGCSVLPHAGSAFVPPRPDDDPVRPRNVRAVQSAMKAASTRSRKMQFTEMWTAIDSARLRFRQTV